MAKKKTLLSLSDAAFSGDEAMVAVLIASHPDQIHRQDNMGFTPLHWAADKGLHKIASMLLAAGASPDIQDMDGLTPLHFAAIKGSLECARLMIPLADISLKDFKDEKTALEQGERSVVMARMGFGPEREELCQAIIGLLEDEPRRKAALGLAAELESTTAQGGKSALKPRI